MAVTRSVQRGSIALAAPALTGTYTLDIQVEPARCWLILNGGVSASSAGPSYSQACAVLALTDDRTVTARRGFTGTTLTIHFTVVEFDAAVVNSIQAGSIAIPAGETSGTATLDVAPGAAAFLDTVGSSYSGAAGLSLVQYTLALSGSVVTATVNTPVSAGLTYEIGYIVVDLTPAVVKSAHPVALSFAAGTVFNVSIPLVDPGTSIVIINGMNHQFASLAVSNNLQSCFAGSFSSATEVTFSRQASATADATLTGYVVEFAAGALTREAVQPGVIGQTTATATALLSPVGADAVCFPAGMRPSTANSNANATMIATTLLNATTVQVQSVGLGGTHIVEFFVIDFGTPAAPEPAVRIVKSVQRVSITIPVNGLSNFATLDTPVDLDNAAIFWNGRTTPASIAMQFASAGVTLTNATTVTATRGAATNTALTVAATVVEFDAAVVNSIQRDRITVEAAVSRTYTLPIPVGPNAFVILNGTSSVVVSNLQQIEAAVELSGVDLVTATLGQSGTTTVYFCVVDLSSEAIVSVQQMFHNVGGGGAIRIVPINPVRRADSIVVCGGLANASSNWGNTSFSAILAGAGTIMLQKLGTAAVTPHLIFTVVQFRSNVLSPNGVQRGLTTLVSALSNTSRLAHPVDPARALCNWAGFRTNSPTGGPNTGMVTSELTDAETQTTAIGTLNANIAAPAWEIIEFAAEGVGPEPEPEVAQARVMVMA